MTVSQKYESHLDRVSTGSGSDLVQPSESKIALPQKSFYSHRALARCLEVKDHQKTVSTVFGAFPLETVETVSQNIEWLHTGLKPGVNEKELLRQSCPKSFEYCMPITDQAATAPCTDPIQQ